MSAELPQANRQIVFAKRPQGEPTLDCFSLSTTPIPALAEGQVLVRNDFLSVDPYIRMRMEERDSYAPVMKLGEVMVGRTVGQVIASRDPAWGTGQWVVGRLGWQDFSLTTGAELEKIDPTAAPLTAYLGALGSTGITAWVGLVHFGRPKPGDTVVVSAAAGAVGSVVGQLARHDPLRAIGAAFVLGAIAVGGSGLKITAGLSGGAVNILMAVVLLAVLGWGRSTEGAS